MVGEYGRVEGVGYVRVGGTELVYLVLGRLMLVCSVLVYLVLGHLVPGYLVPERCVSGHSETWERAQVVRPTDSGWNPGRQQADGSERMSAEQG